MKKIISTINLLFGLSILIAQQLQTYINLNNAFITYSDYIVETGESTASCEMYEFDTNKIFPGNFIFQIRNTNDIFPTTVEGVSSVGITMDSGDWNCNSNLESTRAEIMFTQLTNTGIGWYKTRFYIPDNFKITDNSINMFEHHIFQIFMNQTVGETKVTPLPIFLVEFNHEDSDEDNMVLTFKYGLEFRVVSNYIDCPSCGSGIGCVNCSLNNGIADLGNQYWCGASSKAVKNVTLDYGWNEMALKINWSDDNNGYLDIYLNDNLIGVNSPLGHTFTGPNAYNESMFPLTSGGVPGNHRYAVGIKFGHYSYIHGVSPTNIESTNYFEYFYAGNEDHKNDIISDFETIVNNDDNGILDFKENIACNEIIGADEYVYLIRDAQATNSLNDQYVGSQFNGLTIGHLLQNVDIDFNKNYLVAVSTKFNKGFQSPYSSPKTIKFRPTSKLTNTYCNNLNINYNATLSAETVLEANEYVYYIYDTVTGIGYYSGTGTGQISVATLFAQHNLQYNRLYKISVSPKFDAYGLQGPYGQSCDVTFKSGFSTGKGISIIPNPAKDYVNIELNNDIKISKIEIINLQGKSINQIMMKDSDKKIYVGNLPKGVYQLMVTDRNGEVFSEKLVIN